VAAELGVLAVHVAVFLRIRRLVPSVLTELHARRLPVIVVVYIELRGPQSAAD
jgi:hypothetical protein